MVRYENAKTQKKLILKESIDRAFVYRWINKIDGSDYLGSTTNGYSRLRAYYNKATLERKSMLIYKAILNYGYENFIFEIIEYCSPEEVSIA